MSISVEDEEEIFDDLAAIHRILREASSRKRIGVMRQDVLNALSVVRHWIKNESRLNEN